MAKFIFILLLLLFSRFVYSGDETCWKIQGGTCQTSPDAACGEYASKVTCSSYSHYVTSVSFNGSNCPASFNLCSNGNFYQNGVLGGPVLTCNNGFSRSGNECVCNYPKGIFNGQCQTCPSGSFVNLDTGLCDRECLAGQEYVQKFDACLNKCDPGQVRNSEGYCVADCNYSIQEEINGLCYDKCTGSTQRNELMQCVCSSGSEKYMGQCVPKCPSAQARDGSGNCADNCFNGMRASDDKSECVPLDCDPGQEINYTLNQCVDKPVSCKEGTHREGILCVPDNKDCGLNTHWEAGCNKCVKDGSPIGTCGGANGDMDGDGIPDSSDGDLDGDGIPNSSDSDADGDGIPNSTDTDDDNDGIPDNNDLTPQGPGTTNQNTKCVGPDCDTDGDGIPDGQDPDKDGDGTPDDEETEKAGKAGSPLGDLYEPKGVTLSSVWSEFSARVSYSAIAVSTSTFFSMASISASCPVWTIPASAFYPAITIDLLCSTAVTVGLQLAGLVVLIVAVWVAFRIALL